MSTTSTSVADLVTELARLRSVRDDERIAAARRQDELRAEIARAERSVELAARGCDPETAALAQVVVTMTGRPSESAEGAFTAALEAIAAGGAALRGVYIGAKRYDRFHQRVSGPVGTVPSHGSLVLTVTLTKEAAVRFSDPPLSADERDAAVRWLLAEQARDRS